MVGIYTNVMKDESTLVYANKRFSNSSQTWQGSNKQIDCLIIKLKNGLNLIRWEGNELSDAYKSVFLSNDLVSGVLLDEHSKLVVTTEEGDRYLEIDNSNGYTYAFIPFLYKEPTMSADNMIVTINELMSDGPLTPMTNHMNNTQIHGTTHEDWVFTLSDGITVTKRVVLA